MTETKSSFPYRAFLSLQLAEACRRIFPDPPTRGLARWRTISFLKVRFAARTIDAYCDLRLAFLKRLDTWRAFGRGWSNRVADVRARAKMMAAGA